MPSGKTFVGHLKYLVIPVCEGVRSCRGRHEDAKGSFEAAVRVNPTSARAFFHLGNVQFALQQYEAAETSFHTALKASLSICCWE